MAMLTTDTQVIDQKADWLLVFEAALRVGNFSSFDELLHHALDAWLGQLAPELRWKIAIKLYTNERVSTGRAAEIAGLNYVVFMEKLRERGLPFMANEVDYLADALQLIDAGHLQVVQLDTHRIPIKRRSCCGARRQPRVEQRAEDLVNVWAYYRLHHDEIEQQIVTNETA